jgi:valyl-tRNA synthetase
MLSPFMPFLTEELWHALYDGKPPRESIALTRYPKFSQPDEYTLKTVWDTAEESMRVLQEAVTGIRARRKDLKIEDKVFVGAKVALAQPMILKKQQDVIEKLARAKPLEITSFSDRNSGGKYEKLAWQTAGPVDVFVEYEKTIDVPAERERLTKDIAKYEKGLAAAERQLGNEGFLAKAPAHVVEGLKKQESETRLLLDKARTALEALPPE